jgi:hypothetical protein
MLLLGDLPHFVLQLPSRVYYGYICFVVVFPPQFCGGKCVLFNSHRPRSVRRINIAGLSMFRIRVNDTSTDGRSQPLNQLNTIYLSVVSHSDPIWIDFIHVWRCDGVLVPYFFVMSRRFISF